MRSADSRVHPQQSSSDKQRVGGVVSGVADVAIRDLFKRCLRMVPHRKHVGQHLRWVPPVRQSVPNWNAGVTREVFDVLMGEAAKLDPVVHTTQDPSCVANTLLGAQLSFSRTQVADVSSLIMCCNLECRSSPGRGLLEDQSNVPSRRVVATHSGSVSRPATRTRDRAAIRSHSS